MIREPTRGAEGREAGLQRKAKSIQKRRLRKSSRIKRAGASWVKRSPTQETLGTSSKKQRQNKQIRTLARVLRTSAPKRRIKSKHNNNGGKTEGVMTSRGVMSLKIYSTKREKMKLSTLATKRASKKVKCYRQYKREKVIIKKSNESEHKDWWKRPASWKMNTKRKILKRSTDVYLLKRTIELEID